MKSVTALMVINTLGTGNVSAAEKQLALVAETGDEKKLAEVVHGLQGEHLVLLMDSIYADLTRPSLAAHLVSPEQLGDILGRVGSLYGDFQEGEDGRAITIEDFRPAIEQVFSVVGQVILGSRHDYERTGEFINVVVRSFIKEKLFIAFAAGSSDLEEVLEHPSRYANNEDWHALLSLLAEHNPDAFVRAKEYVVTLMREDNEKGHLQKIMGEDEEDMLDEDESKMPALHQDALRVLRSLRRRALRNAGVQKGQHEEEKVGQGADPFHGI